MFRFPLKNPSPDFESFRKVITGEKKPTKVYFSELGIDTEIMEFVTEQIIGERWVKVDDELFKKRGFLNTENLWKTHIKQRINFYYKMGYDYVLDGVGLDYFYSVVPKPRSTSDTAILSRGERVWAEEGRGLIRSWEDFEKFPWQDLDARKLNLEGYYDFLSKSLPEGMGIAVGYSLYEIVMERLLGYEGLFYLIHDDPELVKEVVNCWGQIVYDFYANVIDLENVEVIFHADDLGYKTSLMLNPETLRELIFPWFKKYASLAHQHDKMYWYHCCGKVLEIMEDLVENIQIDAFHSFQDEIIPVGEFYRQYGNRIGVLGGVDMDKLCRLDEKSLRVYVRQILDECMPGRYALGSGNSIPNYVPIRNYLIMLDEGMNWKPA